MSYIIAEHASRCETQIPSLLNYNAFFFYIQTCCTRYFYLDFSLEWVHGSLLFEVLKCIITLLYRHVWQIVEPSSFMFKLKDVRYLCPVEPLL